MQKHWTRAFLDVFYLLFLKKTNKRNVYYAVLQKDEI